MIRLSEAIARANCTAEITPAFVREAYSLLRQSIIHVEQDDIDFDEEELEGERDGDRRPRADDADGEESQDVEMSAAELAATEEAEQSYNESMGINGSGPSGHRSAATSRAGSARPDVAMPAPPPKRRMVITHDKFLQLQSLIILHLSQVERDTGRGMDRDELVDWYLESKEEEFEDLEEVEYEKELITKMLRKLVKVGKFDVLLLIPINRISNRITTSLKQEVMSKNLFHHSMKAVVSLRWIPKMEMSVCTIWCTPRWIRRRTHRLSDRSFIYVLYFMLSSRLRIMYCIIALYTNSNLSDDPDR